MAKRTSKTERFGYDKKSGYRKNCGKYQTATGTLRNKRWNLGHDLPEAQTRFAFLCAEWLKILNAGGTYWTGESIKRLVEQGIIKDDLPNIQKRDALKLFREPMESDQLAPFKNDKGEIRIEASPNAADALARHFFARKDVRSMIYDEWMTAVQTGRGTSLLKTLSDIFGWSGAQAQQFLFQVQGNMSMGGNPLLFDSNKAKEALGEILDTDDSGQVTDSDSSAKEN
jgi:hypothetical protein